jgi:hypothetical protein
MLSDICTGPDHHGDVVIAAGAIPIIVHLAATSREAVAALGAADDNIM